MCLWWQAILGTFKASARVLPKCQYLLEHTHQPLLQFHVASAIQEGIVREYGDVAEEDVSQFACWLINYCLNHTTYFLFSIKPPFPCCQ